ncbi:MAG: O-antigen ligase family protein [Pyrinomonadaceae bacterium]
MIANVFIWKTPFPFVMSNNDPTAIIDTSHWANRPRMVLGYAYPLAVANFSSLAIISLLASRLNKFVKPVLFLFFLALLIFADGRGALVAALLVLLIYAFLKIRSRFLRAGIVALCAASLIVALVAFSLSMADLLDLKRDVLWSDVDSFNGRTAVWSYAINLGLDRPFTGYGYYASRFELMQAFAWAGHAHNSFVEIFLTTGLIGLLLLMLYTIYMIFVAAKTRDLLLIGLSIYSLIVSFLNPLFFTPGFSMLVLQISLMQANLQRRRRALPSAMPGGLKEDAHAKPRRTRMTEPAAVLHLPTSIEIQG